MKTALHAHSTRAIRAEIDGLNGSEWIVLDLFGDNGDDRYADVHIVAFPSDGVSAIEMACALRDALTRSIEQAQAAAQVAV